MAVQIQHIPARRELTNRATRQRIRLGAYARVSTNNEDQLESFNNQVQHYKDYAMARPEYELIDIYADEGITGTSTRKRDQFKRMIQDCEQGKLDMIITKSISRFARNTQDCLQYARQLKDLGIPIYFERENVNTMDGGGELLFTILSSLAQDESRSISENCAWGIRALFRQGKMHINATRFLGYDKDAKGGLVINKGQAMIVKRIFTEYMNGVNPDVIARQLREEGVPGVSGEPKWATSTIMGVLQNEKYKGDALLQKYFTSDFLSGRVEKNEGQLDQIYVKGSHPAIIDTEFWEATQLEIARRQEYRERHGLRTMGRYTDTNPFSNRVICGVCGKLFWRRTWYRLGKEIKVWQCGTRYQEKGVPGCKSENLFEDDLFAGFKAAWDSLPERELEGGDALQRFRAQQKRELKARGAEADYALVGKVLDHVTVFADGRLEFLFLDEVGGWILMSKGRDHLRME